MLKVARHEKGLTNLSGGTSKCCHGKERGKREQAHPLQQHHNNSNNLQKLPPHPAPTHCPSGTPEPSSEQETSSLQAAAAPAPCTCSRPNPAGPVYDPWPPWTCHSLPHIPGTRHSNPLCSQGTGHRSCPSIPGDMPWPPAQGTRHGPQPNMTRGHTTAHHPGGHITALGGHITASSPRPRGTHRSPQPTTPGVTLQSTAPGDTPQPPANCPRGHTTAPHTAQDMAQCVPDPPQTCRDHTTAPAPTTTGHATTP